MDNIENKNRGKKTGPDVTRRKFITKAIAGAGATTVIALGADKAKASETAGAEVEGSLIRVPDEFTQAAKATPVKANFPMTGAQVFARLCKEEGLAALFSCPGNYPVVNAIALEGIPTYSGRHEGAMCHAADGFCRITGEVAAASGTEGPGFTDMINAIAAANAARSPVLVLASNMAIINEDTEAGIQLGYQQPTTEGLKKYGKRLITPKRVHEYGSYAFRQLRSGVPRPVHLDFPALLPESYGKPYRKVWMLGMPTEPLNASKYYDRLLCFDWDQRAIVDQYFPPSGVYLSGEPSLAKVNSAEGETLLICPRWHATENSSDYVLLNAFALSSQPIAVLPLPHPSPLAFHSSFHAEPAI